MSDSVLQLVWLSQTLSPSLAWHTYTTFGSADAVYRAEPEEYQEKLFLKAAHRHFLNNKALAPAEQILSDCARLGISVVTCEDKAYPPLLREIAAPPLVLYCRGTLPDFGRSFLVAMAGTRRCSNYGMRVAARLGQTLTENGLTVVTGMAQGCDQAALCAALDAGGPVGALVVGGLDKPFYPTDECRALYDRTAEHGFLLSEYPPGTPPHHGLFRMRNRLLSGIAHCLLCIEGGRTSGVMQVADYAAEQGREIFAVPGRLDTPSAIGTNELIQSGIATLLLHPNDILDLARRERPCLFAGNPDAAQVSDAAGSDAAPNAAPEPGGGAAEKGAPKPGDGAAKSAPENPASPEAPAPNAPDTPNVPGPDAPDAPETPAFPAAAAENMPQDTINLQETVDSQPNSAYSDVETALAACTEEERACYHAIPPGGSSADVLAERCGIAPPEMNALLSSLLLQGLVEEKTEGRFFPKAAQHGS